MTIVQTIGLISRFIRTVSEVKNLWAQYMTHPKSQPFIEKLLFCQFFKKYLGLGIFFL